MATQLSSLSILMPAYNDEETIESAVMEAQYTAKKIARDFEIIVIDDASADSTWQKLDKLQKKVPELKVYKHTTNKGYGNTIKELYYKGIKQWLFTVPGDYQIGAKELFQLVKKNNSADMILGWRKIRHDPEERLRQSKIYNTLLHIMFGVTVKDANSVRLMKKKILERVALTTSSAFVDAELIIRAKHSGFTVSEVEIEHRKRTTREESAGGGKMRTILPTILDMCRFYVLKR